MGYKNRDVEIVFIDDEKCMVMACDSAGGIGEKNLDIIKVPPYITGRFTARVALYEIICVGASPKMLSATISNEPFPTGEYIVEAIKDEIKCIRTEDLPLAISTEKNFETFQTGMGITAVGLCEKKDLRINFSKPGDLVYCVGIPKLGNEINGVEDPEIVNIKDIERLLEINMIHDIVPIGSQGILNEAGVLAREVGCKFVLEDNINIDINKSAGPSTCLIFTCLTGSPLEILENDKISLMGKLVEI